MNKKYRKIILITIIAGIILCLAYLIYSLFSSGLSREEREAQKQQEIKINELINTRKQAQTEIDATDDPFGDDNIARILLIGLDSRVGEENGHCDAIQFIEINLNNKSVQITAVPRGTYSPLPGTGHLPSDYYVSKSCEIGGLEYGINQIERIAEKKADYVVLVGFSEVIGILRKLDLPTTETLQWLRHRQGYGVGEPQRAHNHSTFIKQQLLRFLPEEKSAIDIAWQFLIFNFLNTDMSFSEARIISDKLIEIDIKNNPDKISLQMKPEYKLVLVEPLEPDDVGTQNLVFPQGAETEDEDQLPEDPHPRDQDVDELNEPEEEKEFIELNGKTYEKVYYEVSDIEYDEDNLDEYLHKMLDPIKNYLSSKDDYSELSKQQIQSVLIDSINKNINDPEFVSWAHENQVWYQIENDQQRYDTQLTILKNHIDYLTDREQQEHLISQYIIEMQYENLSDYVTQGRELLAKIITN